MSDPLRLLEFAGGAEEHDLSAVLAGPGPDVEHAIRGLHHLRVVLDHHQGIAGVAQAVHHADDAIDIARVQADRRLVQHEKVLTSEVPSAVVRLIRCTSPPDKVRDWRSRFK